VAIPPSSLKPPAALPGGSRNSPLSPLSLPPADLSGFPSLRLEAGTPLFRIHRVRRSPWWFSNSGGGRFDITSETGFPDIGTCYFGREPVGCFIESFREIQIPQEEVEARRISTLFLRSEVNLADCAAARSREFGITAEIHSNPNYAVTQAWAAAFFRAGFDGIHYLLRHNPAQRSAGIAIFGPAGSPADYPAPITEPIGWDLLRKVARRFGVRIRPSPTAPAPLPA
jgi:hypothetical protein